MLVALVAGALSLVLVPGVADADEPARGCVLHGDVGERRRAWRTGRDPHLRWSTTESASAARRRVESAAGAATRRRPAGAAGARAGGARRRAGGAWPRRARRRRAAQSDGRP